MNSQLKAACLEYLWRFHNIREETIYNDLIGYIGNKRNFETAFTYFYTGIRKLRSVECEPAIVDFCQVIVLKPDFAEAWYFRGLAKAALEKNEAAMVDFDRAIKLNPVDVNAYWKRGLTNRKLGNNEAAIADLEQACGLAEQQVNSTILKVIRESLAELVEVPSDPSPP